MYNLDSEYMKVYAMLMLMNIPFSSYKEDGKFILNLKNDKIVVTENGCETNECEYDCADTLVKVFPGIYKN